MPQKSHRRRRVALLLTVAGAVLLLALAGFDAHLKTGPAAYCPSDAYWTASSDNFPEFWRRAAETPQKEAFASLPAPFRQEVTSLFRDVTSLEPSPLWWNSYWGARVTVAQSAAGWGLCVRPGFAMRVLDRLQRRFRNTDGGPVYLAGSTYCAWRDGCLVVSHQRAYVEACLDAPKPAAGLPNGSSDTLTVQWNGVKLDVRAAQGWPISGRIGVAQPRRNAGLTLQASWPRKPFIGVTAADWSDIQAMAAWFGERAESAPVAEWLRRLTAHWGWNSLPEGWNAGIAEYGLAVFDVDTSQVLPVPEIALALRRNDSAEAPHPFAVLVNGWASRSYEWNGAPGTVTPLAGEKMSLCLAQSGADWLVTSREPLMADLAGRLAPGTVVHANSVIELDWQRLGTCSKTLIRRAAELELLPRMNAADAETQLIPLARAVMSLGTLSLTFIAEEPAPDKPCLLNVSGYLARTGS
ncbi:MAG: hypothetical protein QG656_2532 [Candidatus Hydrogenedentes bacterium]|nr:hypothetical protein [Candidatus Hydrogenedentota bacterium]